MRTLLSVLVLIGIMHTAPLRADEPADAIRSVISEQIEAFQADDFETAFSYASPNIKSLFGDPATFGSMVRNGYPMVWRPADVQFSGLAPRGNRMIQNVLITDQSGKLHVMQYEMIEAGGDWQINGVGMRRAGDAGA